jgi:hypothetical protein
VQHEARLHRRRKLHFSSGYFGFNHDCCHWIDFGFCGGGVVKIIDKILNKKTIGIGYLERWHLIPRNRFFNIYLHRFTGNDDERAKHCHPWHSLSIRFSGIMREHYKPENAVANWVERTRIPPVICYRKATFAHRLVLVGNKPCWTIFITGPRIREWGFLYSKGWQHWSTMTTEKGETIGGCE